MVRIDLEEVLRSNDEEESSSLLSTKKIFWNPGRDPRPLKTTIWRYVGYAVFLQGLVCWQWFFRSEPVYVGPAYNVTETVELVTAYYELLQDMRYIGRDMIAYPPHTGALAINQLPYITPHEDRYNEGNDEYLSEPELRTLHANEPDWRDGWMGQNRNILWRNGHFVDYRNDANIRLARDPLQRWEITFMLGKTFEQAMLDPHPLPQSAIALSTIGARRYGLVLVLDTATNRIVVLDSQGNSRNNDPFFGRFKFDKLPSKYKIHKTRFYGEEDVHARHAPDLLRDFIHLTSHLESGYLPGSVRTDEDYTPELSPPKWEQWVQMLYRDYGWPTGEPLEECQYLSLRRNNTCEHNPIDSFKAKPFDQAMSSLRHNITVRYMPDWYCPVPRREDVITHLKNNKALTEEQIGYAESDEPVIPLNLDSWGGRLPFMQG
ncbi:hypothetical protein DL98DRAFT_590948 [Cadophora sp. DSE1049]|nr:hypothetical protein DL98DRAFT_590948 [Cadophora sp. DSE1049]